MNNISQFLHLIFRAEYPVLLPAEKLAYWPAPKNACTSLKTAIYRKKTGSDFREVIFKGASLYHVHHVFPSRKFTPTDRYGDWIRLCVVRDPIERFISTFCNRVLYHNDLNMNTMGGDVPMEINFFVEHLEEFRRRSRRIRHHTELQVYFLGDSLDFYTHAVDVKKLGASKIIKDIFPDGLPRLQEGGKEFKNSVMKQLTNESLDYLMSLYRKDYEVFGSVFDAMV